MNLIHLAEVDSTSRYLRRVAEEAPPPPFTVVLADRQTAGYGQQGRPWVSEAKGLYASIFLGHEVVSPLLTLIAGLAAVGAIRDRTGARYVGLKWVNDLVWNGRKLGGILAEVMHRRWAILGFGINIEPNELPEATSLKEALEATGPADPTLLETVPLALALANHLQTELEAWRRNGSAGVIARWQRESVTIGKQVRVEAPVGAVAGEAVGLDADGRLLVRTASGSVVPISSGTVRLADGGYA